MSIETTSLTDLEKPSGQQRASAGKRRRRPGQSGVAYLFAAPAAILFLVFIVYGIAYNLYNSLQGQTFYGTTMYVGLHHFSSMLQDPIFWSALRNNGLWFVVTVGIQTTLGILLALLIDTGVLGTRFVKTVIFAPVVLSPVVIGLIWGHIYDPYQGLIAALWPGTPDWLGSPQLALISVALVNIWQWTGFSMLLSLAAVQDIPRELREATAIDGASYWGTVRYVILPLLTPATTTLLILGLIGSLQTFTLIFVMTRGGPGNASQVLGTYIYQKTFLDGNFGYGSALSVVLLLITLVLTVLQLLVFNRDRKGA